MRRLPWPTLAAGRPATNKALCHGFPTPQNVARGIADVGAHRVRALLLVELEGLADVPFTTGQRASSAGMAPRSASIVW